MTAKTCYVDELDRPDCFSTVSYSTHVRDNLVYQCQHDLPGMYYVHGRQGVARPRCQTLCHVPRTRYTHILFRPMLHHSLVCMIKNQQQKPQPRNAAFSSQFFRHLVLHAEIDQVAFCQKVRTAELTLTSTGYGYSSLRGNDQLKLWLVIQSPRKVPEFIHIFVVVIIFQVLINWVALISCRHILVVGQI